MYVTVAPSTQQPIDASVGLLLAVLGRAATRAFTEVLRPIGLKPRHLAALIELRESPLTQQALGELTGTDPTKLVGLLNNLEESALIVRRRDPDDRRRHIVEISDCGRAKLAEVDRLVTATEEHMLAGLDACQRDTLRELLAQVAANARLGATCSSAAAAADDDDDDGCPSAA
jgi:DNA-binding MarR family transcriptional regulator